MIRRAEKAVRVSDIKANADSASHNRAESPALKRARLTLDDAENWDPYEEEPSPSALGEDVNTAHSALQVDTDTPDVPQVTAPVDPDPVPSVATRIDFPSLQRKRKIEELRIQDKANSKPLKLKQHFDCVNI